MSNKIRKELEIRTAADTATSEELVGTVEVEQNANKVVIKRKSALFDEAYTVVLNSNQEVKKSNSGVEDKDKDNVFQLALKKVKKIFENGANKAPKSLTQILESEMDDSSKIEASKALFEAYRDMYGAECIKIPSVPYKKAEALKLLEEEVHNINNRVADLERINDGLGVPLYNIDYEIVRIVATNINILEILSGKRNEV